MKVAVIGSIKASAKPKTRKIFDSVCRQIHRVLVDRGDTLLVAHSDSRTAEAVVLSYGGVREEGVRKSNIWATCHIEAVKRAHAVIVIGGGDGSTVASLFAISKNKPFYPIALTGGAGRQFWSRSTHSKDVEGILGRINNNAVPPSAQQIRQALSECLSLVPTVVVIHGRSPDRHDLVKLLTDNGMRAFTLDTAQGGGSIAELWDDHAKNADGAIAIATPDDIGVTGTHDDGSPVTAMEMRAKPRARENVWVEVGWAWGRLSRNKLRLLIPRTVSMGIVPSDLSGIRAIRYSEKPSESADDILAFCRELTN